MLQWKTMLKLILAHRALIVRKLKGLEDIIPYTSVHWEMLEKGSPTLYTLPSLNIYDR